ncbi:MAG: putative hydrolase [Friedmanniella sp.]|nr:putative hydrolase [Friedmanniella sp.]
MVRSRSTGATLTGPWRHRDLAVNGIRLHVVVGRHFGPTRPLVLLLHGFAQFWWSWRAQIPALDDAGYSVAALDLRGYGGSDKTPHGYDPRTVAADVSSTVRSLGHTQAVLVGHDWGGVAAWSTTAYAPDQVRALASVAAPHPLALPWSLDHATLGLAQLPLLPEARLRVDHGRWVETLLLRRAARPEVWSPADLQRYRDELSSWPSTQTVLGHPRAQVRGAFRSAGRDYRRRLRAGWSGPLLTVLGAQDPVLDLTHADAAQRLAHGPSERVVLAGVGHLPHEEDPAAVTAALTRWLGRLPGGSGNAPPAPGPPPASEPEAAPAGSG